MFLFQPGMTWRHSAHGHGQEVPLPPPRLRVKPVETAGKPGLGALETRADCKPGRGCTVPCMAPPWPLGFKGTPLEGTMARRVSSTLGELSYCSRLLILACGFVFTGCLHFWPFLKINYLFIYLKYYRDH